MLNEDFMLYILTARGRVRVSLLRDVVFQLSPDGENDTETDGLRTYKLCRLLDMLGHSEHHRGRPGWLSIVSSHFAKLPILGKEKYVVTGARTASTLSDIRSEARASNIRLTFSDSISSPHEPLSPRRIMLEFESPGDAQALAQRLGIGASLVPASWSLACFSQGLSEFEAGLEWHPRNISLTGIHIYDPSKLAFVNSDAPLDGSFLCRSVVDHSLIMIVRKDEEARVTDHDWGRHWALSNAGIAAIHHDLRKRYLAVPVVAPLPRLLARALCLCSGMAPFLLHEERHSGFRDYFIFSEIPPEIANKVAEKLGICFLPKAINLPNLDKS
jgi:hypothetical protein